MAGNDNLKAYEGLLSANLNRINDFLKFAEAKNAALLTFCSAWIVGALNVFNNMKVHEQISDCGVIAAMVLFVVACCICAFSFMPQLEGSRYNRDAAKLDHILFFGRIAKMNLKQFETGLSEGYLSTDAVLYTPRYLSDLISQMHSNSLIARRKYRLFNWAACSSMAAVIVLVASIVAHLVKGTLY